jgi:hypothetical protein
LPRAPLVDPYCLADRFGAPIASRVRAGHSLRPRRLGVLTVDMLGGTRRRLEEPEDPLPVAEAA